MLADAALFTLGPVTAEAARGLGLSVAAVADRPDDDAVAELLVRHLGRPPDGPDHRGGTSTA